MLSSLPRVFHKLASVFHASVLLLILNFVITISKSLWIHSAIASWIHSYFDNVMTKFIVYNRADAWKTDVHLFFTITNCQIVCFPLLTHRINYKFIFLDAETRRRVHSATSTTASQHSESSSTLSASQPSATSNATVPQGCQAATSHPVSASQRSATTATLSAGQQSATYNEVSAGRQAATSPFVLANQLPVHKLAPPAIPC